MPTCRPAELTVCEVTFWPVAVAPINRDMNSASAIKDCHSNWAVMFPLTALVCQNAWVPSHHTAGTCRSAHVPQLVLKKRMTNVWNLSLCVAAPFWLKKKKKKHFSWQLNLETWPRRQTCKKKKNASWIYLFIYLFYISQGVWFVGLVVFIHKNQYFSQLKNVLRPGSMKSSR